MTKYKQKKLRGKHYIQVDEQILNWRRRRRKAAKKLKDAFKRYETTCGSGPAPLNTPPDAPGCPTIDDQPSPSPTTAYNMFDGFDD